MTDPHASSKWRRALSVLLLAVAAAVAGCGGGDTPVQEYQPAQGTRTLSLAPIAQQTEVWCWAASAEMVFRHYGLPNLNPAGNFQCGIVAAYWGPNSSCWFDCGSCISAIGSMSEIQRLINGYGVVAGQYTPSRVLSSQLIFSALTFNDAAREIDNNRPIVAGISPSGYAYPNISQHAVVIVGYVNNGGDQRIIVNDPFPYDAYATPNPYTAAGGAFLSPGRYSVAYTTLVGRLQWANTVYQIR